MHFVTDIQAFFAKIVEAPMSKAGLIRIGVLVFIAYVFLQVETFLGPIAQSHPDQVSYGHGLVLALGLLLIKIVESFSKEKPENKK